ncbi:MAG TPA: 30S ribosome-binding factor RbfA, partial [Clostridiaceae bacterium]|nr:30S ribosome-binding factor RbfA [Clostridiaceae bacterium]
SSIIQNDIKDPRISAMVSVTQVEDTKHLCYATVYVSLFGSDESIKETMAALKSSARFIRKEVGQRIKLRVTPEILIVEDKSIKQGMHIEDLLHKIKEQEHHDNE